MAVAAHASISISWNTAPATPAPAASSSPAPVRTGTVLGVHGTHVVLRLPDGTIRIFAASAEQAKLLQGLIGQQIRFQSPR